MPFIPLAKAEVPLTLHDVPADTLKLSTASAFLIARC